MESSIEICEVQSDAEMREIAKLRYKIYVDELKRENFAYMDSVEKVLEDPLDSSKGCINIFARTKDREEAVGCIRFHHPLPEEYAKYFRIPDCFHEGLQSLDNFCFISRFMVSSEYRGPNWGVSSGLYAAFFEKARKKGINFAVANCTPSLCSMYDKKGFFRYTDSFYDDGGKGLQVPLIIPIGCLQEVRNIDRFTAFGTLTPSDELDASIDPRFDEGRQWFSELRENRDAVKINSLMYDLMHLKEYLESCLPVMKVRLFKHLTQDEMVEYFKIALASVITVKRGEFITKQGDVRDEMYLILKGKCLKDSTQFLVRGDTIGEVTFLSGRQRFSNIRVEDDAEFLILSRVGLLKSICKSPHATIKLLMQVAKDISREYSDYRHDLKQIISDCDDQSLFKEPEEKEGMDTIKKLHRLVQYSGSVDHLEPEEWEKAKHMGWQKIKARVRTASLLKKGSFSESGLLAAVKSSPEKQVLFQLRTICGTTTNY